MASLGPSERNAWQVSAGAADLTQRVQVPRPVSVPAEPKRLTFEEAAGAPTGAVTALRTLNTAGVHAGQTVVIVGAAGGVGSALVQLSKARGTRVVAIASSVHNTYLRQIGADEMDEERQYTTNEPLVRRELKDVWTHKLKATTDQQDHEDDNRIVLPICRAEVELLAGVASRAEDEVWQKREQRTVICGPKKYFVRRLYSGRASKAAIQVKTDALAEKMQTQPITEAEDNCPIGPKPKCFAHRSRTLRRSFGEIRDRSPLRDDLNKTHHQQ